MKKEAERMKNDTQASLLMEKEKAESENTKITRVNGKS